VVGAKKKLKYNNKHLLERCLPMKLCVLLLFSLLGSCVSAIIALPTTGSRAEEAGQFSVLAYNVYMRPRSLFRDGQLERAQHLPAQLKSYDVLVLSEVFDAKVREALLLELLPEYPYTTEPLGADLFVTQHGGVMIASRWPIEEEQQLLYGKVCSGSDCAAQKGAIYIRINKNGERYNIFGSHLQAWPGPVSAQVRKSQLELLKQFIDSFKIPPSEVVLIAGDLNVDLINFPGEHARMLSILNATFPEPATKELMYTFDPVQNSLAQGDTQEFLDYVLFSDQHAAPMRVETSIVRPLSEIPWGRLSGKDCFDLSDHFAISAEFWFE
jgi:endonuclease/exonuclease/phosphatase family metal-dependent hydrolase